jgi:flagellar basal body-associated protein FliL
MSAGEIIIILVIAIFFVAAAVMGVARPWEEKEDGEHEPVLDDLEHSAEDPTAP